MPRLSEKSLTEAAHSWTYDVVHPNGIPLDKAQRAQVVAALDDWLQSNWLSVAETVKRSGGQHLSPIDVAELLRAILAVRIVEGANG